MLNWKVPCNWAVVDISVMANLLKKSTPDSCITKAMRWEKICMTSVQYSHLQYSPDITPVLVNLLYRSSCQKMFYAATKGVIKM